MVPTPDAGGVIPSFAIPSPSDGTEAPLPCPPASATPSPSVEPSVEPTDGAHGRTDARADRRADADHPSRPPSPDAESGASDRLVTDADPVIALRGVVVRRAGRTILGPLDWTVRAGERWVVLGPNGSGKTTLLSIVGLELWPTSGTVDVLGARYGRVDSREVRKRIGSAGSAIEGSLRQDLTPAVLVMTARHAATEPWWHVYGDDDRARARELLDGLGLARVADHAYGTLSAGERRRTSIARALMPDPDLLLLDEPAASLDLGARETLIGDLARLAGGERPSGIVLVSHHVEEIPPGFTHALVLADGAVVAAGPMADVLRDDVFSRAFGLPIAIERRDGRAWARMATPDDGNR